MDTKTFLTVAAAQALLLSIQGITYVAVQCFQGPYHDVERIVDKKIPVVPQAIFIYLLWFPLIAVYPVYLYSCSPDVYYQYIIATIFDVAVSLLIYLKYPTSFERPPVEAGGLSGLLLRLTRIGNYRGLNCMPSMHCSTCFLIIMTALSCLGTMPAGILAGVCILAFGIICSTVLTKQHAVIDIAAALPLSVCCMVLSKICFLAVC